MNALKSPMPFIQTEYPFIFQGEHIYTSQYPVSITAQEMLNILNNYTPGSDAYEFYLELGISLGLIAAGYSVLKQAEQSRERVSAENAFTLHVMEWFISTYTAIHIDYTISAANGGADLKLDELKRQRKDLIRSYVTREFSIEDAEYLNYLVGEIYAAVFEKTRTVQKAVHAGRLSRMLARHRRADREQPPAE